MGIASATSTRLAFAALFAVHAGLVLATGLGGEWLQRLGETPAWELQRAGNLLPSRWIGVWWAPIAALLALGFLRRGNLGIATLMGCLYLHAPYHMFLLLDLRPRPTDNSRPRPG